MTIRAEKIFSGDSVAVVQQDQPPIQESSSAEIRMISVMEFCRRYGIGRTMAYAEMRDGQLPFCKVRGRRLIRTSDAEKWAASKLQAPIVKATR